MWGKMVMHLFVVIIIIIIGLHGEFHEVLHTRQAVRFWRENHVSTCIWFAVCWASCIVTRGSCVNTILQIKMASLVVLLYNNSHWIFHRLKLSYIAY